jgi:phytoene dehydrogenase-like protein
MEYLRAEARLPRMRAVIATHYLNGAWYPDGGAGEIAKATGAVIRAAGGELLPNHEVTHILLDGGRAVGVEVNVGTGKQGAMRTCAIKP